MFKNILICLWPLLVFVVVVGIGEFVFELEAKKMLVLIFFAALFLLLLTRYIERRQRRIRVGYMVHPPLDGR